MTDTESFAGWMIVEMLGHRKVAGFVTEQQIAGVGFLRIDVPASLDPADGVVATQFVAQASLYALTPVSEEIARQVALSHRPRPVERWELPALVGGERRDDEEELEYDLDLEDGHVPF